MQKSCFWKAETEENAKEKKYGAMDELVEIRDHKPIFFVFGAGTQQHICKKCPINGQYYLTVFFGIIQLCSDILLRIIILTNLKHRKF